MKGIQGGIHPAICMTKGPSEAMMGAGIRTLGRRPERVVVQREKLEMPVSVENHVVQLED